MANIKTFAPFVLKWEGGFVNDPNDRGGATNKGVTLNTYTAYRKAKDKPTPTIADLRALTAEEWADILKAYYWDKWQADRIHSQAVAAMLVDWLWHSGTHGIKRPQRILGVTPDGVVGAQTLAAVNAADPAELFEQLYQARKAFFLAIVRQSVAAYERKNGRKATEAEKLKHTQAKYLKGWLNRLEDLRRLFKG